MVRTQLSIIILYIVHTTTCFRPCILAIVRLHYKLNKWLYNNAWVLWGDEISSYSSGWHVYELR